MGFFDAALAMPTAIFSVLLLVVTAYWVLVLLGALGVDVLDFEADGSEEGVLGGLLAVLGMHTVPVTISLTVVVLLAWMGSFFGMNLAADLGWVGGLVATGVGLGALLLALPLASLAVRPLRSVFETAPARRRASLVGGTCSIATGEVSDRFGQANARVGTDHLLIQVRCAPGNALRKGDEALIIDYDREREVYLVEPLQAR